MALRSLPEMLLHRGRRRRPPQKVTLRAMLESGFDQLAEEPGREIVLGIAGRFWRPMGNILPFNDLDVYLFRERYLPAAVSTSTECAMTWARGA